MENMDQNSTEERTASKGENSSRDTSNPEWGNWEQEVAHTRPTRNASPNTVQYKIRLSTPTQWGYT